MTNSNSDTRQSLLMQVTRAGFALDDAQLFLDTHPCDPGAMAYFQQMSGVYKEAVKAYSAQFGPLIAALNSDTAYWSWISDPWPWEGGMN
mgnify:FL=1